MQYTVCIGNADVSHTCNADMLHTCNADVVSHTRLLILRSICVYMYVYNIQINESGTGCRRVCGHMHVNVNAGMGSVATA